MPEKEVISTKTHLPSMTIAALDLATTTGYASIASGVIDSGVFKCRKSAKATWGENFRNFRYWLRVWLDREKPEQLWYEDVRRWSSGDAAKAYCGLRALMLVECEARGILVVSAAVGSIKKAFTGKGNASKQEMIDEAERRYGIKMIDDNHADALAILSLAIEKTKQNL